MRGGGIALVLVAACGGGSTINGHDGDTDAPGGDGVPDAHHNYDDGLYQFPPGPPITLATTPGGDEDPAVLLANDRWIYVAWFSEDAGNDIVISRTDDGFDWSAPAHVSSGPSLDFGPSLYQDATGTFHAVWFRRETGTGGHIMHNHSADGITWDPATEVEVTALGAWDDWLPSIAAAADGTLVVAFARNTCPPPDECYGIVSSTSADGETWSTPTAIASADASEEHQYPSLLLIGGELTLVWNPYDTAAAAPWESGTTGGHVAMMRFVPGTGWIDRRDVTPREAAAVSVMPTLYMDFAGIGQAPRGHVAWLAADASGSSVVEVPTADLTQAPAFLPITGYSPKLVATGEDANYLGAWVEGPMADRAIVVQVFSH